MWILKVNNLIIDGTYLVATYYLILTRVFIGVPFFSGSLSESEILSEGTTFIDSQLGKTALQRIENFKDNVPRYNMSHPKRGTAIIFNHETFFDPRLSKRNGTNIDRDRMESTLKR